MSQSFTMSLTNVTKYYGRLSLFQDINVVVGSGECLVVTGHNGSGKSTLLKIIAGLTRPSSGQVRLTMNDGSLMSRDEYPGHIGFVSPEVVFYPMMTAYENISFLVKCTGLTISQQKMADSFKMMQLEHKQHDRVSTYSTGMRQRLKFTLLLAIEPALWVLDEPFSNLDASGRELIGQLIDQSLTHKNTIIMATNEAQEETYATKKLDLATSCLGHII